MADPDIMEAATPMLKRPPNDTLPCVHASNRPKRAAADSAGGTDACPAKRVAAVASSPHHEDRGCGPPAPVTPAPQQNDGKPICGDVDVEELLLKALEDELEPQEKNASEAAGVSGIAAPLASSSWLPNVEEDDNYDESDDED